MIKIGISSCFMYPDPNRVIFGPKTLLYMGHDMSQYLSRSGVMPILIPDLEEDELFYNFLDQLDGFLFQGGTHVNPEHYGETPINDRCRGDIRRDLYEMKIMEYALKKEAPVLAICRGMQLLNVHLGGTLHQDLLYQREGSIVHNHADFYDENIHGVEFVKGGLLEKLHQGVEENMVVNSVHQQGIKDLGKNLVVEAICPEDKLVEAIAWTGPDDGKTAYNDGLVMGLQWHPEFFSTMKNKCICQHPVLDNFIKNCKKFRTIHHSKE